MCAVAGYALEIVPATDRSTALEEIVDLVAGHAIDILFWSQRRALIQVCGRNLAGQLCRNAVETLARSYRNYSAQTLVKCGDIPL